MNNRIAILIFTQDASKDASQKSLTLHKNSGLNQYLFRQLNNRINSVAGNTHLPVFRSSELTSQNGTFGQLLTTSIEQVFKRGFDKVICLGNDCLALSPKKILEASILLENHDSVVGPDNRGGVYLLGLSKSVFDSDKFKNLSWQSPQMLSSFLQNIDNQAIIINSLADIHSYRDLTSYPLDNYFISFLIQIIARYKIILGYLNQSLFFVDLSKSLPQRAPPTYISSGL